MKTLFAQMHLFQLHFCTSLRLGSPCTETSCCLEEHQVQARFGTEGKNLFGNPNTGCWSSYGQSWKLCHDPLPVYPACGVISVSPEVGDAPWQSMGWAPCSPSNGHSSTSTLGLGLSLKLGCCCERDFPLCKGEIVMHLALSWFYTNIWANPNVRYNLTYWHFTAEHSLPHLTYEN